ncbi:MAG: hypothetical protein ACXV9R_03385 [Methylobacter sp.]
MKDVLYEIDNIRRFGSAIEALLDEIGLLNFRHLIWRSGDSQKNPVWSINNLNSPKMFV